AYLEGELERAGFFRPAAKQPVMRRNLRNMFHRMQLTEQDVRTLRGMVVRLVEGPRAGARPDKMPSGGEAAPPPDSSDSSARDEG
ncbi:MAG: RNA methyltransferase, partial [Methylocella sp.]